MSKKEISSFFGEYFLGTLHKLLNGVYLPLLESQKKEHDVYHTLHLDDGVNLEIPEIKKVDPIKACKDEQYVEEIDKKFEIWMNLVRKLLEKMSSVRLPESHEGPLAEIEYWRHRSAAFATLWDQFNDPKIKYLVKVLKQYKHSSNLDGFRSSLSDLTKVYMEAQDNVKFLETLERHFKNIHQANNSLLPIIDTLPSMMRALDMVWTISRHYNTEKRMQPLMVLIANKICQKVERYISIESKETIEKMYDDPDLIIQKLEESRKVLEKWKDTYYIQRKKIVEKSQGVSPWDFDRDQLFERTTFIRNVCTDLLKVVRIIKKHKEFFGPKMIQATGDKRGVEDVLALVKRLIIPIKKFKGVFKISSYKKFKTTMKLFERNCVDVEQQIINFVDDSFSKLNSAEGAFKLLRDVQIARVRGHLDIATSIDSSVHLKKIQILDRFAKEVQDIQDIFDKEHLDPPKTKNLPPVAGSIYWAESLFQRIFKPLHTIDRKILSNEKGHRVKTLCHHVGRSLKDYQIRRFRQWKTNLETKTKILLEQNILITDSDLSSGGVNFSPELMLIIQETKYLGKLISIMRREEEQARKKKRKMKEIESGQEVRNVGLTFWKKFEDIPRFALNVTLQESKYHHYIEELKIMLKNYRTTLVLLEKQERSILRKSINDLEKKLMSGFFVLNWNSLGISGFINQCNKSILYFQTCVKKLQKNTRVLKGLVQTIRNTTIIIPPSELKGKRLDLQKLSDKILTHQREKVLELVKKYKTISQTLLKIRGDLISLNVIVPNEENKSLSNHYFYWEKKVFHALFHMVMNNLKLMAQFRYTEEILEVQVSLSHQDLQITPNRSDVITVMDSIAKNILQSTQSFPRWIPGTCQIITEDDIKINVKDKKLYIAQKCSFFHDIWPTYSKNEKEVVIPTPITHHLNNDFRKIGEYTSTCMDQVEQCVESYEIFSKYWKRSVEQFVKKFGEKDHDYKKYDDKIERVVKDIENVELSQQYVNRRFIRVNFTQIRLSLIEKMEQWVQEYGKLLRSKAKPSLDNIVSQIDDYHRKLDSPIENLDQLKNLLTTIEEIYTNTVMIERSYLKLQSCYGTFVTYDISVSRKEIELAHNGLQKRWEFLLKKAIEKEKSLGPLKKKFTEKTIIKVKKFVKKIHNFEKNFDNGPVMMSPTLEIGLTKLEECEKQLEKLQKEREYLVESEKLFDLPISAFPKLEEIIIKIKNESKSYNFFKKYKEYEDTWSSTLFKLIQADEMRKTVRRFLQKLIHSFSKEEKLTTTFKKVKNRIDTFEKSIPLFQNLRSDALKSRHWNMIMNITGVKIAVHSEEFTLKKLIDMKVHEHEENIEDICHQAKGELRMEEMLRSITEAWRNRKFSLREYERDNKKRGYIIVQKDEIKQFLSDDTMQLSNIAGSSYIEYFENELHTLERTLSVIDEVIDLWIEVQQYWINLEVIFIGSRDIREQLTDLSTQFDDIDEDWSKIMIDVGKNRNIKEATKYPGRKELLQQLKERLQNCQKGLGNYLQSKRELFPRFYYLADEELLSILGSSDTKFVQQQVPKMFPNCGNLLLKANTKTVVGMLSKEGEKFFFREPVQGDAPIEQQLGEITVKMKDSLRKITKEAIFRYPQKDRVKWIEENLGMVGLLGCQVWWTWEVEDAFKKVKQGNKSSLKNLSKKLTHQIQDLVKSIRSRKLSRFHRKKITTSIIIDVHQRDIVDILVRDSILQKSAFVWESQLRFYWLKEKDTAVIRQCNGEFDYGYEYQGINGRLVITPLTDRCFITLTQALTFHLGGSPAGPAGTGKTESVKDLAKAMGRMCVVFNCNEGLDNLNMSRLFSGLAQNGAFGCFDEFNRIELSVLSVIATQIRTIQEALRANLKIFRFEDQDIRLDKNIGVFVTMNPGYAGRVELPDNLKALFRPCVMVVPDYEIICEILLFSEGFMNSRKLSRKMVKLYSLAEGQLSKQKHYDWGLRAIKTVLVKAGHLKIDNPTENENKLLMKALYDMNVAKFIFEDRPLFEDLLNDLFVFHEIDKSSNRAFFNEVKKCLQRKKFHLLDDQNQIEKVIQLRETLNARHSTMIVGDTCGGKSVVIETLAEAQTNLGYNTILYVMNPKAQTVKELFGVMNSETMDWEDGLLSNIFREINQKSRNLHERRYIVFDGDVDPIWVESMNSVMDDNKLLTLPNGERISLIDQCKLLFEVGDLNYSSPATVSRCGMVYVDPKNLGYTPYFYRWLKLITEKYPDQIDKDFRKKLHELFNKYAVKSIDFVNKGIQSDGSITLPLKKIISYTSMNMCSQLCTLCESVITDFISVKKNILQMETLFMFCVLWSVGSTIIEEEREKFDHFLKEITSFSSLTSDEDSYIPLGTYPQSETLYDYYVNPKTRVFESWKRVVPKYAVERGIMFSKILVPTIDTVRYKFFLEKVLSIKKPVLFIGNTGTAKTSIVNNFIEKKLEENAKKTSLNLHFSSRTTSMELQRSIEDHIEKRLGDRYGPKDSKQMYIFIDEMNMPREDIYGTQQAIAFLKFVLEKNGFYERKRKTSTERIPLIQLQDVDFVCAMRPQGFALSSVDSRFISKFSVFNLTFPSNESIFKIYSSIINSHFNNFSFDESFQALGDEVTRASISLHEFVVSNLPPTPTKFHYVFNLRELSRIYEGLCLASKINFDQPWKFIKLWRNECRRVYYDRLIEEKEKKIVAQKIDLLARECYRKGAEYSLALPLLFGDFEDVDRKESLYNDLESYDKVKPIIEKVVGDYNIESGTPLNLVMFDDAIDHLVRIYRIIKMNRGHGLLVGVGGSGKKSLTRLAAHLAGYDLFDIKLSRNYNEKKFREDLKDLLKKVGLTNRKVVFLFTDDKILDECFLEYLNNLLTSGMVYALFDQDEKIELTNEIAQEAREYGLRTIDDKWKYFVEKCRNNLHIVLGMSPGKRLRERCRSFPGIVSNTTIDWFQLWPEQALTVVAQRYLEGKVVDLRDDTGYSYEKEIVKQMVSIHLCVKSYSTEFYEQYKRYNYVTPKNYISFILQYLKLLKSNRKKITDNSNRLSGGLSQLSHAKDDVAIMQKDLTKTKEEVEIKQREVTKLQREINEKQKEVTKRQEECKKKEKELNFRSLEIAKKKDKAQELLVKAEPLLLAAESALQELQKNKAELTEMKSFRSPHVYVKDVGMCITILLSKGKIDPSWKLAQIVMSSSSFISDLVNFNKKKITDSKVKKIREIMKRNGKNFTSSEIKTQSRAAAVILTWIENICDYYDNYTEVKPLRQQLERETQKYNETQAELMQIQEKLAQLQRVLKNLDIEKESAEKESESLLKKSILMKRKLKAANKLINGLSSERTRWSNQIEKYKRDKIKLIGDCLLCAGFLSYLGPFTIDYRTKMLYNIWLKDIIFKKIPVSRDFQLKNILTDDAQIAAWESEGLPSDEVSIQNGILTTYSIRFPLCIDPQLQAVKWIKEREKKNLIIKNFNEQFMKYLENAIRFGQPFLFEDVDEMIDPIIEPILDVDIEGKNRTIVFGEEKIDVDKSFKLFLCTRISNPYYSPEIQGKTSIINYSVTFEGLQEQLLSEVVKFESRSLENERVNLIHQTSENKTLLQNFERKILQELNVSKEISLLNNVELIEMLEETRKKVVETNEKLRELNKKNKDIKIQRETYRKVAKRGAILFFVMSTLSGINQMYEYSLSSYMKDVFQQSLERSKKTSTMSVQTRLSNIIEHLTYNFYCYTCNGLFEKDKVTFAMLMCLKIMEDEKKVTKEEIDFFIKGNISLRQPQVKRPFEWIPEKGWKDLLRLERVSTVFQNITKNITKNEEMWKKWFNKENVIEEPYPEGYNDISPFQKLCILRCFRIDKVLKGVSKFISSNLGKKFVSPPVLDYIKIFRRSVNTSPIICLISHGYDPAGAIIKLSDRIGQRSFSISLGQGVGEKAKELILRGILKGYWIILQNCHLLVRWLKEVEKILSNMENQKVHSKFRLWMTTELHEKFPCSILQRSLKIVTEPPNNLKLNMISSYSSFTDDQLSECESNLFKPLIFVLTYFHAVLQERKKYGKIGWNVPYDFNKNDYLVSFRLLKIYLNKMDQNQKVPWTSLRFLVGETIYGGRITDMWDRRILITYLNEFMGDFIFDTFQPFHFYDQSGIDYKLPVNCVEKDLSKQRYIDYIENTINLENSPEVIGLNANAEIRYLTDSTKYLWSKLIELESKKMSKTVVSSEEKIKERIKKIQNLIPKEFDRENIIRNIKKKTPILVVLLQEIERFNKLIKVVNVSLTKLTLALNGKIGMSLGFEDLSVKLTNGIVPQTWKKLAPPTKKNLSSWLENLQKRHDQYDNWIRTKSDPPVIWLSGLHIPESYLTSIVQGTCKKKNWPLDKVVLFSEVTKVTDPNEIKKKPEDGCFVKGLFLEGASWDKEKLELSEQKPKVLLEKIPIVKITPIEIAKLKTQNTYKTPVYFTSERNNRAGFGLCFDANLKTKKDDSHWTLSGTALILNDD